MMSPLEKKIRRVRQQIVSNLDQNFNYIDQVWGEQLDKELIALKKKLKPNRDNGLSERLLRLYA